MQTRQPVLIAFEQAPLGAGLLVLTVLGTGAVAVSHAADTTTATLMTAVLVGFALLARQSLVSRGVWFDAADRTFTVRRLLSLDARRFLSLWPAQRFAAGAGDPEWIERVRHGRGGIRARWYVLSARLAQGRSLVIHRQLTSRMDADRLAERLQRVLCGVGDAPSTPAAPEKVPTLRGSHVHVTISSHQGRLNREAIATVVVLSVFASFFELLHHHATIGIAAAIAIVAVVATRRLVCRRVTFDPASDSLHVTQLLGFGPHRAMCLSSSSHRIDRPLRVQVRTRQRTWRGGEEHDLLADVDGGRQLAVDAPFESIAEAERAAIALPQRLRR